MDGLMLFYCRGRGMHGLRGGAVYREGWKANLIHVCNSVYEQTSDQCGRVH